MYGAASSKSPDAAAVLEPPPKLLKTAVVSTALSRLERIKAHLVVWATGINPLVDRTIRGMIYTDPNFRIGEKVHIITRRLFSDDVRRHFAGVILVVSELHIRTKGYVFVFNSGINEYQRRTPQRERVFSISDGNVFNIIPSGADIEALRYQMVDARLMVTDGHGFRLDINEFGATT